MVKIVEEHKEVSASELLTETKIVVNGIELSVKGAELTIFAQGEKKVRTRVLIDTLLTLLEDQRAQLVDLQNDNQF